MGYNGAVTAIAQGDATTTFSHTCNKNDVEAILAFFDGTFGGCAGKVYGSADGTNFSPIACFDMTTRAIVTGGTAISLSDNVGAIYAIPCEGLSIVRWKPTAWTSGSLTGQLGSGIWSATMPSSYGAGAAGSTSFGAATFTAGMTFSGATTANSLAIPDNLADAWNLKEGTNSYIKATTTNSSEAVTVTPLLITPAGIQGIVAKTNGATAITTTRAVTRVDSGGVFTVAQSSAYTVTVAQPSAAGERYQFQLIAPGAFDISLVATGCTFEGTITIDAATIPATGSTLKFASGSAILGDNIEIISTSTTKFLVRAIGSGAGGITIT